MTHFYTYRRFVGYRWSASFQLLLEIINLELLHLGDRLKEGIVFGWRKRFFGSSLFPQVFEQSID
mgnify:CR=1 FL=1